MPSVPFLKRSSNSPSEQRTSQPPATVHDPRQSQNTDRTLTPYDSEPTKWQLHRATRTRKTFSLMTSFFLLISVIFLILIEIGNTHIKPVLTSIWFIKLDLSEIVPTSIPNSSLLNTIAQTLGLHDFYQVGLWNFCEGYLDQGITDCSTPQTLYWFDPVAILESELLAGATIALPSDINNALRLIKAASQFMFGFFLTGICLSTVLIFVVPLSLYSRWAALPIAILTLLNALLVTIASVLGTAMFIIMRNVLTGVQEVNIGAEVGVKMFAFMWVASAFSIFAWLVQTGLCCCCASRRDVKKGKKRGSKHAWENGAVQSEKPQGRRFWYLKRRT